MLPSPPSFSNRIRFSQTNPRIPKIGMVNPSISPWSATTGEMQEKDYESEVPSSGMGKHIYSLAWGGLLLESVEKR